ncbi:Translation machinery-associated protein 22 [Malassezia yamatoensis]|uniref:Translation machinery-associated protein 22 n=1 Tax=Malassezia yamatoensis TaxID=253288 RepID=A0AAJ5YS63_9BASI|nr:Translation machinery-associated protein 22 [Malassezia yamatoensis]
MSAEEALAESSSRVQAREVRYCEICTFPYEYCEYGSSLTKCKANLEAKNPRLYSALYSEEALTDKLKSLTTEQLESLERDSAKRERKAQAKAEKERAQLAHPGIDEIHIQGDVVDEVKNLLLQHAKPFEKMPSESEGGISEKNVVIDDKAAK